MANDISKSDTIVIEKVAAVDRVIQKVFLIQCGAILIYGLLLFEGLEVKKQIDRQKRWSHEVHNLLSPFGWIDSLATLSSDPIFSNQYLKNLQKFRKKLQALQQESPYSDPRVVAYFVSINPHLRTKQTSEIIKVIKETSYQGAVLITHQLDLIKQLIETKTFDDLGRSMLLLQLFAPYPKYLNDLYLLANKMFPNIFAQRKLVSLRSYLARNHQVESLPASKDSLLNALENLKAFVRTKKIEEVDAKHIMTSALKKYQLALQDSIKTNQKRKGKIKLAITEKEFSVRYAFYFAVPLFFFLSHFLILSLQKKKRLQVYLTEHGADQALLEMTLAPTFLNYLYTADASKVLKLITGSFVALLCLVYAFVGVSVIWFVFLFLPAASTPDPMIILGVPTLILVHLGQICAIAVILIRRGRD